MVQSVLLRAFFFAAKLTLLFVRPTDIVQSLLHPNTFHKKLSHHITALICPFLINVCSQHSLDRIQPNSFLQFLTVVFSCPLSPVYSLGLSQKHVLHILRANHSHVHRHLFFKCQGGPVRPLDAQISGLAHNNSCSHDSSTSIFS